MEKVMIIGINGMLGHALAEIAPKRYEVIGTYYNFLSKRNYETVQLDIVDRAALNSIITKFKPNVVINCAAITDVNFCEDHYKLAKGVHMDGTKNLSDITNKIGAKFIHISTNFVFDGTKGNYTEGDLPNPLNVYGKTKYEGEKVVSPDEMIVRTCIYGWNIQKKQSMVEWVINELEKNEPINVFDDSFFTPIYTGNLSEILLDMLERDLKGLYHVAGSERINKYDFALKVAEVFNLNKKLIKPCKIDDMKLEAKRPKDTSLCCNKIKNEGFRLKDVLSGLERMKNERTEN